MFWQMTLRASVQLSVEPLEEGYPLGEIRLGPGVVEPAFARLVAGETVAQRGGAGVYLFHVPHGEGEAQRRRSVRQGGSGSSQTKGGSSWTAYTVRVHSSVSSSAAGAPSGMTCREE